MVMVLVLIIVLLKTINLDSDNWQFTWRGAVNETVYQKYNFDLRIIDSDGCWY